MPTDPPTTLRKFPGDRPGHFVIAVCVPLVVSLAIAKAFAAGTWSWWSVHFPAKWGVLIYHDAAFVCTWAAIGLATLALTHRLMPRALGAVRVGFLGASTFICLYAIAGAAAYGALRMQVTYSLLEMASSFADVRSSLGPYLTWPVGAALIMGPAAYLWAVAQLRRMAWVGRPQVGIGLVGMLALYLPVAAVGYDERVAGGPDDGLAASPHVAMLESCFRHWFSREDGTAVAGSALSPALRQDFLPVGERMPSPTTAATSPVKNVIVVVLESTGTQFLSLYGSEHPTTPYLQSEAGNAVVFNHFYANAGYTLHAMMPLVLSVYPGNGWKTYVAECPHLPGTSLAQVLRERGYRTAFMTGGCLDFRNTRQFLDDRGFDQVLGAEDFQRQGVGAMVSSWGIDDPPLFDHLVHWIDEAGDRPFYAMAWTQQTHHPYTLPPGQTAREFIGGVLDERSHLLNLYLNDLCVADRQLGRLFEHLRARHLDGSTLVVVTGDHGEAFGFPHPWLFHGTALYEESVNVPCVFWNPSLFADGRRSDVIGAQVDLNPTIAGLLGITPPGTWQGRSLFDSDRPNHAYFTCNTGNLLEGLRDGDYKFIYNVTLARQELYDLATDPHEHNNLSKSDPDRCADYRRRLAGWASYERGHLAELVAHAPVAAGRK